jgi:GT2 family glycosyltransferase
MSAYRPKVSVGLPVYNRERFVAESLDSILEQTFKDFELIISDNASTDRTAEICRAYAARDSRIRYCRNDTNLGAANNYNRVFELSSGEYFKWLASDDVCAPSFLDRCLEALDREPTAVLSYPRARCINEYGEVVHNYEGIIEEIGWPVSPVDRFRRLVDGFVHDSGVSAAPYVFGLIRSDALRQTRLIGNYISSDLNLLAELALLGTFVVVPEHLSFIRSHPESSSWPEGMARFQRVQEWFDPTIRRRKMRWILRWRRHAEYLVSVARSDLEPQQKATLLAYSSGAALRRLAKRARQELATVLRQVPRKPRVAG